MYAKLAEHEGVLKEAEQVLSMIPAQQQVVAKKEEPRPFATFRQQADLKPSHPCWNVRPVSQRQSISHRSLSIISKMVTEGEQGYPGGW